MSASPLLSPRFLHIIDKGKFKVGFDARSKLAAWVFETLTPEDVEKKFPRPKGFYEEKELPKSLRVSHADYQSSGYTRGHFAASADFSGDKAMRKAANCFSNIAPQLAEINQIVINGIEQEIRTDVLKGRVTQVMSGPIFESKNGELTIKVVGPSGVWVPNAFFKAWQVELLDGGTFTRAYEVEHVVSAVAQEVTIAELEARTGIIFPFEDSPFSFEDLQKV